LTGRPLEPLPQPDEAFPTVIVDPMKAFQEIVGFGGALTDAAAETFAKLPKERQRELLDAYFDPVKGIGYSLARTPDGRLAAVVLNTTDKDKDFALWVDGRAAKARSPAHSIVTMTW